MSMKGYSATIIIGLIVAVAIAGFVLYLFWSKVVVPGGKAYSETYCKQHLAQDCMSSMQNGWATSPFHDVKGCEAYVENKTAFENCVNSLAKTEPDCMILCKQFI